MTDSPAPKTMIRRIARPVLLMLLMMMGAGAYLGYLQRFQSNSAEQTALELVRLTGSTSSFRNGGIPGAILQQITGLQPAWGPTHHSVKFPRSSFTDNMVRNLVQIQHLHSISISPTDDSAHWGTQRGKEKISYLKLEDAPEVLPANLTDRLRFAFPETTIWVGLKPDEDAVLE